ncbi:ABC transporter substrate-binding protein [Bacteroidota bacterium]
MRIIKQYCLLLIIFCSVTFFGCKDSKRVEAAREAKGQVVLGGTLNVPVYSTPATFLPSSITNQIATQIGTQVHCGLLRMDPQSLEVVEGIATSWSVDEAGTSYVFKLRGGASFHPDKCFGNSRREVTAEDFKYSFYELCKPNSGAYEITFKDRVKGAEAYHNGETNEIEGIDVVDDYTLRIELLKPDPSFLFVLAQPSTAVISKTAHTEYGDELKNGAGPFMWAKGNADVALVRNPNYFQQDAFGNTLPYIDTLNFKVLKTKELELEALFKDEIDMVVNLSLDPVKLILEQNVRAFSGSEAKYVLNRETESAGYDMYTMYNKEVRGFDNNFMSYWDFARVQMVPAE